MDEELQGIVENMVRAGESEDNIALVIQNYSTQPPKQTYQPATNEEYFANPQKATQSALLNQISQGPSAQNLTGEVTPEDLEAAKYFVSKPRSVGGAVKSYVAAFNKPVVEAPGNLLKSIGVGGSAIDRATGASDIPAEETPTYQLGQKWNEFVKPYIGQIESQYQDDFGTKLMGGLGSLMTLLIARGNPEATGGQLAAQGVTQSIPKLAAQGVGNTLASKGGVVAGTFAIDEYEQAKKKGLPEDEAFNVFLKNYFVNQTDAIPIESAFSKLNTLFKGGIAQKISAVGQGGLVEGTQEGIQTYLTNQIAKGSYDPNRDELFGVLDAMTVGGVLGMLLPAIGAAAQKAPPGVKEALLAKGEQLEDKAIKLEQVKEATDKALEVVDTGSPELNASIDTEAQNAATEVEKILVKTPIQNAEEVRKDQEVGTESRKASEGSQTNSSSDIQQTTQTRAEASNTQNQITNEKGIQKRGDEGKETISKEVQGQGKERGQEVNLKNEGKLLSFNETPEYKAADQKVREIADQIRQNPDQDELFSQLNEAKQERDNARIAFEQKPTKVKQEKSIKMTPTQALKHQVQTFYKGVEKGVKKGKELTNDLVTKVQETLKEQNLTPKQTSVILSKVKSTNLFTPGSVSKLNQLIDRVSADAAYAESLGDAESFRSDIKKHSKTKVESIPNNYKVVAKEFSKINPDEVADLEAYKQMAAQVTSGFKAPTSKDYSPINIDQVRTYINRHNETKQGEQVQRLREEFQFGEEFSDDEIAQLLETEDLDEEEFYQNKDQARKTIARDRILRTAQFAQTGIQAREGSVEETLGKIDLNKLSDGQLVDYVRTVDNIIQNDDYTNSARIESISKAVEAVDKLRKLKSTGEIGKFKGSIYNMPMLFNAIYSDSKAAAKVQLYSGLQDVYNGGSRVEGAEGKLFTDFRDKAKEIEKKTGKDPLTADTQVRLGLFAPLVRFPKGTQPNLEQSKRIVEQSILRLKNKKDRAELAKDAERLYQPFKQAKTVEEVFDIMRKVDPAGLQMWEFFNKKFDSEVRERLKSNAEEVFNETFIEEENYTPKSFEIVDSAESGQLDSSTGSAFYSDLPGKPKQAKTAIAATNSLPKGRALNFEFYQNMFRKYRESEYDIETSRPRLLFREFLRLPESTDVLGGLENKQRIIENYKKSEEIQRGVGKDYGDVSKFMDEAASTLRTLGYTAALGSVDQIVKQYVPVAVNTMFNLGGDGGLFFSRIPEAANKLFDMYTIGQRGKRLGGAERGESTRYKIQSKYRNRLLKGVGALHKMTDKGSSIFMASLTKGDVSVAQRSWAAYYLQSLKKAGVDLKTVDLGTEYEKQSDPIRREAAAYAEQKVKETQVVSNPAELAKLLRTQGAENWIKNIFIPFSTFSVNTKVRLIENIRQLRTNPNKADAYRALAGTVSEIALYSTIKFFLLSQLWDLFREGAKSLFDLDSEDEEDKTEFRTKQWYSAIYKDMFPFAVGAGGENASIEFANGISYLIAHPDATYAEWKKELNGGPFYQYQANNAFDMGLYSIGLERLQKTIEDTRNLDNLLNDEAVVVSTPYGEKEVELDSDQQKFMAFMVMMDWLSSIGLSDAQVFNQLKKIQKEQLKGSKGGYSNKPYVPKPTLQKPYIPK